MPRLHKTTQVPFTMALTLIFAYGLLLAVVPTHLTATTRMNVAQASLRNNASQSEHIMTASSSARQDNEDAKSVR